MTSDIIRSRLIILTGLAVLGVSLAGVGTVLGMPLSPANPDPAAQFIVSEQQVTLENGGNDVVLVDNMSNVREIQVETVGSGQFRISTREEQPITPTERKRAIETARSNETVQDALDSKGAYTVSVEPVQIYNVSSDQLYTDTVELDEPVSNQSGIIQTDIRYNVTLAEKNESSGVHRRVTFIHRNSTYAEHRAVVKIRQPGAPDHRELKYSIDVNLQNRTVTDIIDWGALRQNTSIRNVSTSANTT